MLRTNLNSLSIVLFDDECLFCNRSVKLLIRLDSKQHLHFASIDFAKRNNLLANFRQIPDSMIFLREGKIYFRSDAVIQVGIALGGIYKAVWLLQITPRYIRNYCYDLVAKYRVRKKLEVCQLASQENRNRFLE